MFRRNQLWHIVGIKFWMVEVYHETQDAWCCGRQRLNKNGAYWSASIILHGNHLLFMSQPWHFLMSCLIFHSYQGPQSTDPF